MYFRILFIALGLCCLFQCSDRKTADYVLDPAQQYAYFPLKIGKYVDYTVDSIVYDFSSSSGIRRDSARTWVREMVTDTLRDNTGALVYVVDRSEKSRLDDPWAFKQRNTASINKSQAVRTEDNLRFLKLVFPLDRRTRWDGNYWIDPTREIDIAGERIRPFSNWNYTVDSMDVAKNIGSFAFDSVLVVTEANASTIYERRLSRAHYAKHVGLVQREQWILDSQYCNQSPAPTDCSTKPWQDKAERGYILKQTLVGFN